MKKRRLIPKNFIIGLLLVCAISSLNSITFAQEAEKAANSADSINTFYLLSTSVNFQDYSNYVTVMVETDAVTYVNSIYHTIKIYKNGSLVHNQTYYGYNRADLLTLINIPAVSGDGLEVRVDHYTSNNGVVEYAYSNRLHYYDY